MDDFPFFDEGISPSSTSETVGCSSEVGGRGCGRGLVCSRDSFCSAIAGDEDEAEGELAGISETIVSGRSIAAEDSFDDGRRGRSLSFSSGTPTAGIADGANKLA